MTAGRWRAPQPSRDRAATTTRLRLAATLLIAATTSGFGLWSGVGCARRTATPLLLGPGTLAGSNVLLITIDTLRRDRLGAYGSTQELTPTLDRLAAEGLCFTQAYSHAPMTLPAHASILTGLTPSHHGVHDNVSFRLAARVPTLASSLKRAGYRTAAFVGAFVLDERFGLNTGFDTYDDRVTRASSVNFEFNRRNGSEVVAAATDWIAGSRTQGGTQTQSARPYFAWVHLYDPHAPYEAPPEFRIRGRGPYDAAVAYTDSVLGSFLERLGKAHALDRTLVVVTADHGESLGDHGETTHGLFAYGATIDVPLIFWSKGSEGHPAIAPARTSTPVAHVDIAPTVLDLLGVAPLPATDGQSLTGEPASERVIGFEALDANITRDWAPLIGIVRSGWKYIDLPVPELYDLARDPGEKNNLASREPRQLDLMTRIYRETAPSLAIGLQRPIDDAAAARLRSLGYVGGGSGNRRTRTYTDRDDPKALVGISEQFADALELFNEGRADRALDGFMRVLRARPDFITARTSAATILVAEHRAADAATLLREAPPEQRTSADVLGKLGQVLAEAGDPRGAIEAIEAARRAGNQNPDLLNSLGVAYARLGRLGEARTAFNELLGIDPAAAGTWYNLGLLEVQGKNTTAGAAAFRHAVDADPTYADAWQALGSLLVNTNRPAAIDAWIRAERLRPNDYDLLFNLGSVLADSHREAEALPYLQRFVREAPRDRYASDVATVQRAIERIERQRR